MITTEIHAIEAVKWAVEYTVPEKHIKTYLSVGEFIYVKTSKDYTCHDRDCFIFI